MNPINHDQAKAQLDKTLQGNDKIETAIAALQQDATEEMLAHVLTVIRRRTKERAQLIIAVEPPKGDGIINLQAIKTSNQIMSTFTADIDKLFYSALEEPSIEGVIINPWNRTIMLNKTLINIILGNPV